MEPAQKVLQKPYQEYWRTLDAYGKSTLQVLPDTIRQVISALGEQLKKDAIGYTPPLVVQFWIILPTQEQLGIDLFTALLGQLGEKTFFNKDQELIRQVLQIVHLSSVALDLQSAATQLPSEKGMDGILNRLQEHLLNREFLRRCPTHPFNRELLLSCVEVADALQRITGLVYAKSKKTNPYPPELKRKLNFCTDLLVLSSNPYGLCGCAANHLPALLFQVFKENPSLFGLNLFKRSRHYQKEFHEMAQERLKKVSQPSYLFLPDLEYCCGKMALVGVTFYFSQSNPVKLQLYMLNPSRFHWIGQIPFHSLKEFETLTAACQLIETKSHPQEFTDEHSSPASQN